MLIFIENIPMAYAWGSPDALPELLGTTPNGEPQAELWLGTHPEAPATVAKASPKGRTLIDLIESDPELYGVDGGALPFLLKILAIGAPLSLQVHPNIAQAIAGFAAEEAAGLPHDARERNYGDANHKPELLVALSEITALSGFRSIDAVRRDLRALAAGCGSGHLREALEAAATHCGGDANHARGKLMEWSLGGGDDVQQVLAGITEAVSALSLAAAGLSGALHEDHADGRDALGVAAVAPSITVRDTAVGEAAGADTLVLNSITEENTSEDRNVHIATGSGAVADAAERVSSETVAPSIDPQRLSALASLIETHPGDPGIFVSLMLHLVHLQPGEAIYLGAQQLHAYLGGIGVEVMAASDNVLRAGLTQKHVDVDEVNRIVDLSELESPRINAQQCARGLVSWEPAIPDFRLFRARLRSTDGSEFFGEEMHVCDEGFAERVQLEVPYPVVLIATGGRVRVERRDFEVEEVASVRRGQSLYVSAGGAIELSGTGEVFVAAVGRNWPSVSQDSTSS